MCGIFGFYLKRNLNDQDIKVGIEGLNYLKHRGPDYTGYWFDKRKGIFLGHNRLSIIDTSDRANQPFIKNDKVLLFNGEIYNYLNLKKNKVSDFNYFTTSDTEVLFNFLDKYDCENLSQLDGMFSFVFLKNNLLNLGTDIFSEKFLFYHTNSSGIYFSSEAKPLIDLFNLKRNKNFQLKKQFMSLGYVIPPDTAFDKLYITEQSSIMKIYKGNIILNQKYYKFPKIEMYKGSPKQLDFNDIKLIKNKIIECVESRMHSDVNKGIFLSSGIDSSLVASIMKKELNLKPVALTISYNKYKSYDESEAARKIAKYLNIDHIIEEDSESNFNYSVKEIFEGFNLLNDNISLISIKNVSNIAKKYFKVAISGNGGDEMFYGYGKHIFFYKYQKYINNNLLKLFKNFFNNRDYNIQKFDIFTKLLNYKDYNQILLLNNYPFFNNLKSDEEFYLFDNTINDEQDSFQNFRDFNINYNLPNSIIYSNEIGSMSNSVELRSPLLSREILELISSYDYRSIMKMGRKGVLIKILEDYLPKDLISASKKGFISPIDNLLSTSPFEDAQSKRFINFSKNNYNWKKLILRKKIFEYFKDNYS